MSQTQQATTALPLSPSQAKLQATALTYKRVCVLGLGYVGLPTALMFALGKFDVQGVDVSPTVLENIENKAIPELYPELTPWWNDVIDGGLAFRASESPEKSDLFLITVPTPVNDETKHCDLSAVKSATKALVPVLEKGNMVILESTVPPGTTSGVVKEILESTGLKAGIDFHLCFSPERVLPGNTIHELVNNHRVLGGTTRESAELAKAILSQVIEGEIYLTDDKTAEFCKLAENTYRDVNIALANELSILADDYGIRMTEALRFINMHPRVNILRPGIGVGGHCIAVDPWFFVEANPKKTRLIGTSRKVNDDMPGYCAGKILEDIADLDTPRVCCVGLTYKPDVGDTRESPALHLVEILRARGVDVVTYDPVLPEYEGTSLYDVVEGCDYLALLVNHSDMVEEIMVNRGKLKSVMRTPRIRMF